MMYISFEKLLWDLRRVSGRVRLGTEGICEKCFLSWGFPISLHEITAMFAGRN